MGFATMEEKQPLVQKAGLEAPRRTWRGALLNCFGGCEPHDLASCCLVYHAPAIAWGWNGSRALRMCWLKEVFKFLLATVGLGLAAHAACCAIFVSVCGPPPPHGPGGPGGMHMGGGPRDGGMMMRQGDRDHMMMDDEDFDGPPHPSPECMAQVAPYMALLSLGVLVAVAAMVMYAAKRRQAIREQFGIEGTFGRDLAAWACCSFCALNQETRTLMHENVHGGLWHGPLPAVAPPALPAIGVPAAQQMV